MSKILDSIMSSSEASTVLNRASGTIKNQCERSEKALRENRPQDVILKCKKIGRSWILAKDQSAPAQYLLDNCIGTAEAAEILNKSQVQVKWLCRNKKIVSRLIGEKTWVIDKEELLKSSCKEE